MKFRMKSLVVFFLWVGGGAVISPQSFANFDGINLPSTVSGTVAQYAGTPATSCPIGYMLDSFRPIAAPFTLGKTTISLEESIARYNSPPIRGYCKASSAYSWGIDGDTPMPFCVTGMFMTEDLANANCQAKASAAAADATLADKISSEQQQIDQLLKAISTVQAQAQLLQSTMDKLQIIMDELKINIVELSKCVNDKTPCP